MSNPAPADTRSIRSVVAVATQRLKLGIHRPNPKFRPYTAEEDRLMGTMPDEELAKKLGRTFIAVRARREKLGIAQKQG